MDPTTRQPVKGRQRHGGIRLGEMERDALVAHGTAFLVHDRLMRCSDYSIGYVCTRCGSMITPLVKQKIVSAAGAIGGGANRTTKTAKTAVCGPCTTQIREKDKSAGEVQCEPVEVPFVFRLLTVEMGAMGIELKLKLKDEHFDSYLVEKEGGVVERVVDGSLGAGGNGGKKKSLPKKLVTIPDSCYRTGEENKAHRELLRG